MLCRLLATDRYASINKTTTAFSSCSEDVTVDIDEAVVVVVPSASIASTVGRVNVGVDQTTTAAVVPAVGSVARREGVGVHAHEPVGAVGSAASANVTVHADESASIISTVTIASAVARSVAIVRAVPVRGTIASPRAAAVSGARARARTGTVVRTRTGPVTRTAPRA